MEFFKLNMYPSFIILLERFRTKMGFCQLLSAPIFDHYSIQVVSSASHWWMMAQLSCIIAFSSDTMQLMDDDPINGIIAFSIDMMWLLNYWIISLFLFCTWVTSFFFFIYTSFSESFLPLLHWNSYLSFLRQTPVLCLYLCMQYLGHLASLQSVL